MVNAEDIVLTYDNNILLRRWLGTWIDLIVLLLIAALVTIIFRPWLSDNAVFVGMGFAALYFPLAEGLTGFTLGKLAARVKVVDLHGNPPGIGKATLRTVTRILEVNPLGAGGLIAGICVLCTKKRQRLGDMLAHTYVVKIKDLHLFNSGPSAIDATPKLT